MTDPQTARRVLLLDSASIYFRAYFGQPDVTAPDGTPVGAVRGFLSFLARLVDDYRPTDIVCCWDEDWRPQWRVDLIPSYKAHRVVEERPGGPDAEEVPDELEVQVPILLEVLDAFGLCVVGAPNYEADDVIGTLATRHSECGHHVEVVTGDRDLYQLVDDAGRIRVIYIGRGMSRVEHVDDEWIRTKFGVDPQQYVDLATLRGDTSDGLPGVYGIGDTTAAKLIHRYGDVAGILAAASDPSSGITPKMRANLLAATDYLAVAPTVVAVARDIDLGEPDTTAPREPRDPDRVAELAERYGLDSPTRRLVDALRHP